METVFLSHQVKKAVLQLYEGLSTPVSLKAAILLRTGEWDQLAEMHVEPAQYSDPDRYWRDAMASSLLRKLVDLPTSVDRKANAIRTFRECEDQCYRSNFRLYPYIDPCSYRIDSYGVLDVIHRAQKFIGDVLGPCPDIVDGRFGPGATYGDRGRLTTVPDKMSSVPTLTHEAWSFHFPWSGTLWAEACSASNREVAFVPGNRFTTVPKDCLKDRGIAIEPSVNVFFQLSYGKIIRNRLKSAGINLADGQDIHRQLACEASIKGHLATLDLSNASDTICKNLVKLLLPPRWFSVLDDLRSHKTLIDGKWVLLEKFSSMGNGFTFELETLIFLGLIMGLGFHDVIPGDSLFVYGDDIIVPTSHSKDVIALLEFFGLTVNTRKSFVSGPFRESCGGDYFMGVDVRPLFLKESPNEPQQLISFANGLNRASKSDSRRWRVVFPAWRSILDALPSGIRSLRGPEDLGDLCIHDNEECWRPRWRNSIRYFRVYRPARYRKVSWQNFRPEVILASALYGVPSGEDNSRRRSEHNGFIIPRDSVSGYKIGWVPRS